MQVNGIHIQTSNHSHAANIIHMQVHGIHIQTSDHSHAANIIHMLLPNDKFVTKMPLVLQIWSGKSKCYFLECFGLKHCNVILRGPDYEIKLNFHSTLNKYLHIWSADLHDF